MKLKITNAFLLILCFAFLAVLSGAVPVLAEEDIPEPAEAVSEAPPDAEYLSAEEDDIPAAAVSPDPTPETDPSAYSETPLPTLTPEPAATPTPAPMATPDPDARVIAETLVSDDLIDNDTYYDIDPRALLSEGLDLTLPAGGYQILIIHTHTTEAYYPDGDDLYESSGEYRTTDIQHSVARVGEELAAALSAYGLNVLHDTALYDYPSYNGSYARSGDAIADYLAAYPGIRLVIDLHRDAIGSGDTIYKTVTEAEGVQAAQIMFVMGSDVNLEHPDWRENLKLALTLQTAVGSRWETLMRPTVLCDYRYNQQLTTGSLLMEVGTTGNTLQEAINAVKLFADAVGPLLVSLISEA